MSQVRSRGGEMKKEVEAVAPTSQIGSIFLLKVTLQQAFECLAVAGLVTSHLVDGASPAGMRHRP